jgi:hypothetical protein
VNTTTCPFSQTDDRSCPVLHPGGSCLAPEEVAELVRTEIALTAAHHGLDPTAVDVALEPGRVDGGLRVVLRTDAVDPRLAHQLAVRAHQGLCTGARAATTIDVYVRPRVPAGV